MGQTYVSSNPTSIHLLSNRAEAMAEPTCCVHAVFAPGEKTTRQDETLWSSVSPTASSLPVTGPVGVPKMSLKSSVPKTF